SLDTGFPGPSALGPQRSGEANYSPTSEEPFPCRYVDRQSSQRFVPRYVSPTGLDQPADEAWYAITSSTLAGSPNTTSQHQVPKPPRALTALTQVSRAIRLALFWSESSPLISNTRFLPLVRRIR